MAAISISVSIFPDSIFWKPFSFIAKAANKHVALLEVLRDLDPVIGLSGVVPMPRPRGVAGYQLILEYIL